MRRCADGSAAVVLLRQLRLLCKATCTLGRAWLGRKTRISLRLLYLRTPGCRSDIVLPARFQRGSEPSACCLPASCKAVGRMPTCDTPQLPFGCPRSTTSTCSACASTLLWTTTLGARALLFPRQAPDTAPTAALGAGSCSLPWHAHMPQFPAPPPPTHPAPYPFPDADKQGAEQKKALWPVALQVDVVAVPPGPDNPAGNAWTTKETDLLCEAGKSACTTRLVPCALPSAASHTTAHPGSPGPTCSGLCMLHGAADGSRQSRL